MNLTDQNHSARLPHTPYARALYAMSMVAARTQVPRAPLARKFMTAYSDLALEKGAAAADEFARQTALTHMLAALLARPFDTNGGAA